MIEVRNLTKLFGTKKVLRDVNFHADGGEFVALLGPNGAGKSTFLRILASLLRPSSGEVRIAGYRLPGEAAFVRAHLGVVTHQALLYGDLTAEENLIFYGRIFGISSLNIRVDEVLNLVGLSLRRKELVRTFSRGMQQRLSIGRAILHDPDVILFDEPYTGLDQEACGMLDKILREVAVRGRTIVMASHDLSRLEGLADRFDVISKGVITASTERNSFKGNLLDFYLEALSH
jgi:heme exporter protein A